MIQAIVFDAYGTLFDVQAVAEAADGMYPGQGKRISQTWRRKQLEYTWLRSLMGQYRDFAKVNRDALTYTLQHYNFPYTQDTLQSLLSEYLRLPPHPEVRQALKRLGTVSRSILSNGTFDMLQSVVRNADLNEEIDHIFSVNPLKTYKPDPNVYQSAVDELNVPKQNILFVSSNGWDVAGAKTFGFTVAWVNRDGKTLEELGVTPDLVVPNLLALVDSMNV